MEDTKQYFQNFSWHIIIIIRKSEKKEKIGGTLRKMIKN